MLWKGEFVVNEKCLPLPCLFPGAVADHEEGTQRGEDLNRHEPCPGPDPGTEFFGIKEFSTSKKSNRGRFARLNGKISPSTKDMGIDKARWIFYSPWKIKKDS
jgi:hypothetical protein